MPAVDNRQRKRPAPASRGPAETATATKTIKGRLITKAASPKQPPSVNRHFQLCIERGRVDQAERDGEAADRGSRSSKQYFEIVHRRWIIPSAFIDDERHRRGILFDKSTRKPLSMKKPAVAQGSPKGRRIVFGGLAEVVDLVLRSDRGFLDSQLLLRFARLRLPGVSGTGIRQWIARSRCR